MLRILVEKELRDILYSTKFSITFGASALLVMLSFYVGIRNYQESMREYESAKSVNVSTMATLTDWNGVQHKVFREPEPLQVLVNGVANDVGRTTDMRVRGELSLFNSRYSVDPLFAVFRFLDLNFVIAIVFSLFAILFGYDAINGEKESGTLKLVFSNAVSRADFILGKLFGSILALIVPLIVPFLVGCLMVIGFGVPISADEWIKLLLIILSGFLYFGAFLAVSIFISAVVSKSSVSFLFSLVVWIFSVLIIPKTSILVASQIAKVPNVDAVDAQKRKFLNQQLAGRQQKMQQFMQSATFDEGFSNRFNAFNDSISKIYEKERETFFQRLNEDWRNKKEWQERWAFRLSRISPTAIYQIASSNLAGTDVALKQRYLEAVNKYQEQFGEFMMKKGVSMGGMRVVIRSSGQQTQEEQPKPINVSELPQFVETRENVAAAFSRAVPDLGFLVVLNIVLFAAGFVAFLKFDVR
ncbi:MAG: ABC transporter permease subunit [Ignavibacteriales bacterium]|nr:ABC transporter permease subunit [Ignavibacteriales bacterium]